MMKIFESMGFNDFVALSALAVVAASCSVLEERMACPCSLVVDYADVNDDVLRPTSDGMVYSLLYNPDCTQDIMHKSASCPDYDTISCTKGDAVFSAIYTPSAVPLNSALKEIRYSVGTQVDSVYGGCEPLTLLEETEYVKVNLHKQFSTINLIVKQEDTIMRHCNVTVLGRSCGYDVTSLSPIEGEYRHVLENDTSLVRSFRIPRQADCSLVLHVENPSDGRTFDFPLGERLYGIGYDFDAPDLSDFDFEIDLAWLTARIKVKDWGKEYLMEVYE